MTEEEIIEEVVKGIDHDSIISYISSQGGITDMDREKKSMRLCLSECIRKTDNDQLQNFQMKRYAATCEKEDGTIKMLTLNFSETISSYTYCE
jgi:hypothetical protein